MTILPNGVRCLTAEEMREHERQTMRPISSEEARKQFEADRVGQMSLTPEGLVSVEALPYARNFWRRTSLRQSCK